MKKYLPILKWIFGVLFIIASLQALVEKNNVLAAVFSLALGLFLLPPSWKFISEKAKINISPKIRWIVAIVLMFGIGISTPEKNKVNDDVESNSISQDKELVEDVSFLYKIENRIQNRPTPQKIAFNVRLNDRVTEEQLRKIGNQITRENTGYTNYFIVYYLPQMNVDDFGWATTNCTPTMNVKVIGTTIEENRKIQSYPLPENTLGDWSQLNNRLEIRSIIYEENDSVKMKNIFIDGSIGNHHLLRQDGFLIPTDNPELFYKIEANGNLGLYDYEGKYREVLKSNYML